MKVDRDKIIQLFTNIIGNGVKYTGSGGKVTVGMREDGDFLVVTVADTGNGIPEEDLPYIFDKYRTVGEAGEGVARTGLGLYISRKIIELHGGEIHVDSRVGEGTTFTVTLQRHDKGDYQKELQKTLDLLSDMIAEVMHVKITSLMLVDQSTDELTIKSSHGLDPTTVANTRLKIGDKIAGWVALEGKPLLIEDMEKDLRMSRRSISQYNTKSLLSVPIKVGDRVTGVLNVNNKEDGSVFTEGDLELCTALAERVGTVLHKLDRYNNKNALLKEMSRSLETLVKAKKEYPADRESTIGLYIFPLLKGLGISAEEGRIIYYASTLYDLGLGMVTENALKGSGPLSDDERRRLREHPLAGLSLIEPLEFVEMVKMVILHHHEHYDGTGYPDGLAGQDIPLGARILAVLDSFCAMTRPRRYRPPKSVEQALEELENEAGTRYDPAIVRKFIETVNAMREE
ncbi:MAG: ATP-binding protein [Nitrospirota bacterium]|nr:ATP-binding protein [Nitrospirota bacterium]